MPEPSWSFIGPTPHGTTMSADSLQVIRIPLGTVTSSSAATRARRTVAPASTTERERRHSALSSSALLRCFARALFSERIRPTAEPTLPGLGNDSETSSRLLATLSCPSASVPVALGRSIGATGCSCSPSRPTPTASLFGCRDVAKLLARRERCKREHGNGNGFGLTLGQWCAVHAVELTPEMVEQMLGFPAGWTDCAASATPLTCDPPAGSGNS